MPNRLADETSPYLLQHAENPVEWYPWGEEALERARAEEKPILLSIGYAACHWCHVMAHESFEDDETAAIMNRHFVNIKVDREERPDLDGIYMQAVVAMTRSGGWPMTVFLTPAGEPFFGGTYFPPTPRFGMPAFRQVLESVADAWRHRRAEIESSAQDLAGHLQRQLSLDGPPDALRAELLDQAVRQLEEAHDAQWGGFGGAPKFPQPMTLEFLLRASLRSDAGTALAMAERTLERMAWGGIYDQIGGGFARYSTDERWLVPHFEKMLYDNALLARVYLHAYQVTGRPLYRRVVVETLDFVTRELRHDEGGFFSSLDADSEGEEGRFYVWRPAEIREALGADATLFMRYYGVSERGNWEGKNILHVPRTLEEAAGGLGLSLAEAEARLGEARRRLYTLRAGRVWPGLDDKVLTAWNGLMLAAYAEAGAVLDRPDYLQVAEGNARFLRQRLRDRDGRLWRTWRDGGTARYRAYLEDYAFLADGLLALYQATFDEQWFSWAHELIDLVLTHFRDPEEGGFYDTADDHETLIQRPKEVQDNALPSGNAMAVNVLQRLALYTGEGRFGDVALPALAAMVPAMARYPTGFAHWLCAAAFALAAPPEVAIAGAPDDPGTRALLDAVRQPFRPHLVLGLRPPGAETDIPLLAERRPVDGRPAAYVCRRFVCQLPVTEPDALVQQLI